MLAEFMFEQGILVTNSGLIVREQAINDILAPQAISINTDGIVDVQTQGIPVTVNTPIEEVRVTATPIKNGISIPITVGNPIPMPERIPEVVPVPAYPNVFPDQEPANEPPKVLPAPLPEWDIEAPQEVPDLEEFKTGQRDMLPPSKYWEIFPETDWSGKWKNQPGVKARPKKWPDEIPTRKEDLQEIPRHVIEEIVRGKEVPVTFEEPSTKPDNLLKKLPLVSMAVRVGLDKFGQPTIDLRIRAKPETGRA